MFSEFVELVHEIYGTSGPVPLHAPVFRGNEKKYLENCIDSTFVSSVGEFVNAFEKELAKFTGANYAVVTSNGTSALHVSLLLAGVKPGDIVITQALSFIATSNAIIYANAQPVFVDVDLDSMGLSPKAFRKFLEVNTKMIEGKCTFLKTGQRIAACVPMHTFGMVCRIKEIKNVCDEFGIVLVEDAAESIGSYWHETHTGLFGQTGVLSFNGNKTITSGGGGALITNDEEIARHARHLTTQAKVPHAWEFNHDEVGYNYRMPNLNAALALAQLEMLPVYLKEKKEVFSMYREFFAEWGNTTLVEPLHGTTSNHWLNAVLLEDRVTRDEFLEYTNENKIMTRPAWTLMHKLPMFSHCVHDALKNSIELENRIVNIPSSAYAK
jgi:perosamine synthetase